MSIVDRTFDKLIGLHCWGVEYDSQLNISLSFGKPVLYIREPPESKSESQRSKRRTVRVKGEWWLWIFCSYWKISFDGKKAAGSSSGWRQIMIAIGRLNGQILKSVSVNPKSGATRFEFDLGGVLEVRRFERDSSDVLWMLYKPNGYVLAVRGDGQFTHEKRSRIPEKLKPRRIVGRIEHH